MNNRIILGAMTPGIDTQPYIATYSNNAGTTSVIQDSANVSLISKTHRCNKNYATFEVDGIDLTDATGELANASSPMPCVTNVTGSTTAINNTHSAKVVINFTGATFDLNYGVTITFWRKISSTVTVVLTGGSTKSKAVSNSDVLEFEASDFSDHSGVSGITIYFNSGTKEKEAFVGIKGIDFGKSIVLDKFIGNIDCFGEICLTVDDLPAGSCDFTVVTDLMPEEGQKIEVQSTNYNASYIISDVERQAEDVFAIKCTDLIQYLEGFNYSHQSSKPLMVENIVTITGVSIDSMAAAYQENTSFNGWLSEKVNCRQWLAMLQAATLYAWYAFGFVDKIGNVLLNQMRTFKNIPSSRILGQATYQHRKTYKGTRFTYKSSDNNEYPGSANETEWTVPYFNAGWYDVSSDITICDMNTDAGEDPSSKYNWAKATAENALFFLNGNEITANIVYQNEKPGDLVRVETPYNGTIDCIIRSVQLSLNTADVATIVCREVIF